MAFGAVRTGDAFEIRLSSMLLMTIGTVLPVLSNKIDWLIPFVPGHVRMTRGIVPGSCMAGKTVVVRSGCRRGILPQRKDSLQRPRERSMAGFTATCKHLVSDRKGSGVIDLWAAECTVPDQPDRRSTPYKERRHPHSESKDVSLPVKVDLHTRRKIA